MNDKSTAKDKPSLKVIRDMNHRDMRVLIDTSREGRVVTFYTPSSFYVQLFEEDVVYDVHEREMNAYYDALSRKKKYYGDGDDDDDAAAVKEITLEKLENHAYIAAKISGKWSRYITGDDDARCCRTIDTGATIELTQSLEKDGLFELEERFLALPPRAVLCGLAGLTPKSNSKYRWKTKACQLLSELVHGRPVKIHFVQKGLFNDSSYVLFTCRDKDNTFIHAGWLLIAFDLAYAGPTGIQHPLWPCDTPC